MYRESRMLFFRNFDRTNYYMHDIRHDIIPKNKFAAESEMLTDVKMLKWNNPEIHSN